MSLAIAVLTAGCSLSAAAGTGTTSTSEEVATGPAAARSAAEAVRAVKQALAGFVATDPAEMKVVEAIPSSPMADTVLEWTGGKAELDSRTGVVYAVSTEPLATVGAQGLLTEDRLRFEAVTMAGALGWTEGALQGLGFRQEQSPSLGSADIYTITWTQYDAKGAQREGSLVLTLDGKTAGLVSLSALVGSDAHEVAGAITEAQAMQIAQTQIYLNYPVTAKPKLSLAGDGSLILLNRRVTEQLKVVDDSKIVGDNPRLCWVMTVLGTVGTQTVGGTVYLDAANGEVLKYEAHKTSEPVTTSTTGS